MPWLLLPKLPDGEVHPWESASTSVVRQMRVPARSSQLHHVRRCADDAAAEFGFAASERYQFVFAVNEAVTNAIRHGRPAEDGTIGLRIHTEGDSLICSVDDHGTFLPSPPESDPLAERGRGLTLMALLMDDVELSTTAAGTTVRLYKRRCARPKRGLADICDRRSSVPAHSQPHRSRTNQQLRVASAWLGSSYRPSSDHGAVPEARALLQRRPHRSAHGGRSAGTRTPCPDVRGPPVTPIGRSPAQGSARSGARARRLRSPSERDPSGDRSSARRGV